MDGYKHTYLTPCYQPPTKNAAFHLPTYAKALSYLPHIWKMEEAANKPQRFVTNQGKVSMPFVTSQRPVL